MKPTTDELEASLEHTNPNDAWPALVQAMWWDRKGDWHRSHEIAQDVDTALGSLVHAYLHRKEGDLGNAGYWYRRAQRPICERSLEEEWHAIVAELISDD